MSYRFSRGKSTTFPQFWQKNTKKTSEISLFQKNQVFLQTDFHIKNQLRKYRILVRLAGLLLFLCISIHAKADKKIYLLADIHVMAPSLLDSSDNAAWQRDLANQRKMQDLSAPVFDRLIERIITDRPDLLFICGDLTKDGEKASHEYVINKLTKVKNAGIRIYVIPGNHDHGTMEEARIYANNSYATAEGYSKEMFRKAYRDFGYGESSEIHEASLSYCTELYPGLTLIGIDTDNTAHISGSTIKWIWQKATEARDRGNQVIAMAHHSLIPHFYGQESFMIHSVINSCEQLRDSLISAGVKVVFTGHYHVSDNTRYTNSNGQNIYDICTGSPISYPCDFRILTFDDEFERLKITTETVTDLDGYEDFPGYARNRLKNAFNRWASKWFAHRGVDKVIAEAMSESITNAFIIHAEGNEPENPASAEEKAFYDDLLDLSSLFEESAREKISEVCLSVRSMLGDYPSDDEQDNLVDDRELTIIMPDALAGVHSIRPQDDMKGGWYTLQGLMLENKPSRPGIYINNRKIIIYKP